ncbi:unnamed protein product, partial [Bubo scandiacus]
LALGVLLAVLAAVLLGYVTNITLKTPPKPPLFPRPSLPAGGTSWGFPAPPAPSQPTLALVTLVAAGAPGRPQPPRPSTAQHSCGVPPDSACRGVTPSLCVPPQDVILRRAADIAEALYNVPPPHPRAAPGAGRPPRPRRRHGGQLLRPPTGRQHRRLAPGRRARWGGGPCPPPCPPPRAPSLARRLLAERGQRLAAGLRTSPKVSPTPGTSPRLSPTPGASVPNAGNQPQAQPRCSENKKKRGETA